MTRLTFLTVLICSSLSLALSQAVAVRSVKVKGTLKCGNEVAKQAKVVLYRVPAEVNKVNPIEELDNRDISPAGLFEVGANTNGRPINETELKPAIRVFHRCDVKEKALAYPDESSLEYGKKN
uniref:Transthyretin-like family protein n=1 Tax=Bursaphelenchus xylophilus TaxID=6326 RepID=A0A1I7RQY0_BURXY